MMVTLSLTKQTLCLLLYGRLGSLSLFILFSFFQNCNIPRLLLPPCSRNARFLEYENARNLEQNPSVNTNAHTRDSVRLAKERDSLFMWLYGVYIPALIFYFFTHSWLCLLCKFLVDTTHFLIMLLWCKPSINRRSLGDLVVEATKTHQSPIDTERWWLNIERTKFLSKCDIYTNHNIFHHFVLYFRDH